MQLSQGLYQSKNSNVKANVIVKNNIHILKPAFFLIASLRCSFPVRMSSVDSIAVSLSLFKSCSCFKTFSVNISCRRAISTTFPSNCLKIFFKNK